jgi:hypothetical protein
MRGRSGGWVSNNLKRDSDDQQDHRSVESYIEFSLESLILAQDERWRRA